jgi:hypothetical protein
VNFSSVIVGSTVDDVTTYVPDASGAVESQPAAEHKRPLKAAARRARLTAGVFESDGPWRSPTP